MQTKIIRFIAYVANLWLGKQSVQTLSPASPRSTQTVAAATAHPLASDLTESVSRFLQSTYDFRYNLLTEETEFRPAGRSGAGFIPVGKRELNSFCLEAHAQHIPCWDKDIIRYIYSTHIPVYHPFHLYLDELPRWDGVDRLEPLARRVSSNPLWIKDFHIWMRALTAQWMGVTGKHANSVAPLLVSSTQGCLKSTFCKSLMPNELARYYSDEVELTSRGNVTRKMSEMGLLNLDEFDKYPASKMPLLKNLMQMADLNLCKAYQKNYRNLPRIASFIGTSNRFDLLSDPTGSRRFLCIEVQQKIDCSQIEHAQVYAQLKQEIQEGMRYWFTVDEEQEIQLHNEAFRQHSPADDMIRKSFRPATSEDPEESVQRLSAADMFSILKKQNPAAMLGLTPNRFSQMLSPLGFVRVRGHYCNCYPVVNLLNTPSALKPR